MIGSKYNKRREQITEEDCMAQRVFIHWLIEANVSTLTSQKPRPGENGIRISMYNF